MPLVLGILIPFAQREKEPELWTSGSSRSGLIAIMQLGMHLDFAARREPLIDVVQCDNLRVLRPAVAGGRGPRR